MVRSMTGYGQAVRSEHGYTVRTELKSVNHRYAEIVVRLPREWTGMEDAIRKDVAREIRRGRVDAFIAVERETAPAAEAVIDWTLAEGVYSAALQLKERFGLQEDIGLRELLRIPDLVRLRERQQEQETPVEPLIRDCTAEALDGLLRMRESEGSHLRGDLASRLTLMRVFHGDLRRLAPQVPVEYAVRLRSRIREMLEAAPVDEARLAAEIVLFADRSNIDEELTRLDSHFNQMEQLLSEGEPIGRKLDFLLQEMNREVNTVGSKANHADLTRLTVEMKAELEKIREQAQNIE